MTDNQIAPDLLVGWKVLIVDDEMDSADIISSLLEMYGAEVIIARGGQEGFDLAVKHRPRFIISDLSMPGVSGWEMLNKIKTTPATADIPVIALTAHAMKGDRERAFGAGFHNYLSKPLRPETFVNDLLILLTDVPVIGPYLKERGIGK